MNGLVQMFAGIVKGVLSGFDRIVFKGSLLQLMYEEGARRFLWNRGVLNKDYKDWMLEQTGKLVDDAVQYAAEAAGRPITPVGSWRARKEELAREGQRESRRWRLGVRTLVEMHPYDPLGGALSATDLANVYAVHIVFWSANSLIHSI